MASTQRVEQISKMGRTELARHIEEAKKELGLTSWYAHPLRTWNKDELVNLLIEMEDKLDRWNEYLTGPDVPVSNDRYCRHGALITLVCDKCKAELDRI